MITTSPPVAELIEAFVLGTSCFLGGDQYFIMISQSPASPKSQYYITLAIIILSLIPTAYMKGTSPALFNGSQALYSSSLLALIIVLYQKINSVLVPYILYHFLTLVLTFLIIQSAAHYSKHKNLLLSFILGLFASRLMPSFCWMLLTKKSPDKSANLHTLAFFLALLHWLLALASLILRFTQGTLSFLHVTNPELGNRGKIYEGLDITIFLSIFKGERISLFAFLFFGLSISLFIGLPPTVTKLYFNYSSHLISNLSILEMVFHLLGSSLGIVFPASKSCVHPSFYVVNLVIFYFYIYCTTTTKFFLKIYSHKIMFVRVILASLAIGYNWSYNLGVFIGYLTGKTCKYDEISGSPCCGEKTETQCYCRLESIVEELNKRNLVCYPFLSISCNLKICLFGFSCTYKNRFSCSKSFQHSCWTESFNYHPNGPNAILLYYDTDSTKIQSCTAQCANLCETTKCKCLKLLGVYKIESVTTSTCDNCQLTIRLEAKSACSKNGSCSGSESNCVCENGNCCCISTKCCEKAPENCCCIKFCKCNQGRCSCNCKTKPTVNLTRLFMCFENGDKCCIKEIRPNFLKEFTDDLKLQNEFDIKSIYFSDCCHTDLIVILECSMKNNFFRPTPINYPKKTIGPLSLTLMRKGSECCKSEASSKCCCTNNKFVKVCVKYDGTEKNCSIECNCKEKPGCCCAEVGSCCCCTDGKCCCCLTCDLSVNRMSSFYMKFESLKVPFASISIYFIVLLTIFFVCIVSYIRESTIPPYIFSFKTNLKSLNEVVNSRGLNTDDLICKRITYALTSKDTIYVQSRDTEKLLNLFSDVLGNNSCQQLRKQVASQSNRFIASSIVDDMRKKIEMVRWCYATGFVYAYFTILFKSIQKFFAYWEEAWISEFKDYKTFVYPIVSKISHKAKFSLSSFSESEVVENGIFNYNGSRSTSWSDVLVELDMFSDLYTEESQVFSHSIPYRLDLRFQRYLDRWEHRLTHVRDWIDSERSVYDWNPFMSGLRIYKSWFEDFQRYLTLFSYNVTLPSKELEKHTQIFLPRQIK